MNGKIKTISAALLAAVICASFAGCADKKTPTGGNNKNPGINESKIESRIENIFGGESSSKKTVTSKPVETSKPEVKFEMTDEIKNAAFNSGFIQINNDIFQQGGYITVADFVAKYKDRYDIVYQNANLPYEEAGEYLLQSVDYVGDWKYHLLLTPKAGVGDSSKKISVQIENRTTTGGEDKIPLAEGIVTEFNPDEAPTASNPYWFPQGFTNAKNRGANSGYKDLETANEGYKKDSFIKMLEDKGFTLFEGNQYLTNEDLNNRYWKDSAGNITFQVSGEVNSFGRKPVYQYVAGINADTDKLGSVRIMSIKYVE